MPSRYVKKSPEVIGLAAMVYVRIPLSLRNVKELLHEREIDLSNDNAPTRVNGCHYFEASRNLVGFENQ